MRLLGSPYLYDRHVVFSRHENKHCLTKARAEYIVGAHHMKLNSTLVNVG